MLKKIDKYNFNKCKKLICEACRNVDIEDDVIMRGWAYIKNGKVLGTVCFQEVESNYLIRYFLISSQYKYEVLREFKRLFNTIIKRRVYGTVFDETTLQYFLDLGFKIAFKNLPKSLWRYQLNNYCMFMYKKGWNVSQHKIRRSNLNKGSVSNDSK